MSNIKKMFPIAKRPIKVEKKIPPSNDVKVGPVLGKGGFGTVYKLERHAQKCAMAVKVVLGSAPGAEQEREIHELLNHPNILECFGQFVEELQLQLQLQQEQERELYTILEYAPGGTLHELLNRDLPFVARQSAKYIFQLTCALMYCHANDIAHCDIKPDNILLGWKGDLKLADFGVAVRLPTQRIFSAHGFRLHLPPEFLDRGEHDHTIDVWSMGILLYRLFTNEWPYQGHLDRALASFMLAPPDMTDVVPVLAQNLIRKMRTSGHDADYCRQLKPSRFTEK